VQPCERDWNTRLRETLRDGSGGAAALARLARPYLAAKTGTETRVRRWRFLPSAEVDTPYVTGVNDESSIAS
jgi:membrane peptidoglycan carboxypeptidase